MAYSVPCRTEDRRFILCDRGSLDPLAYWLARGWEQERVLPIHRYHPGKHYRRYTAVIHLVTTADGAEETYRYWPAAHRSETPEQAVRIDRLLRRRWEATHVITGSTMLAGIGRVKPKMPGELLRKSSWSEPERDQDRGIIDFIAS